MQLVVVTFVMRIIVMRLLLILFDVGLMPVLILEVLVALFRGMISLWSMHRA
jgi:hypothetical protein